MQTFALYLLQMLHSDALPQSILADITRIVLALNVFNTKVDYNKHNVICHCPLVLSCELQMEEQCPFE